MFFIVSVGRKMGWANSENFKNMFTLYGLLTLLVPGTRGVIYTIFSYKQQCLIRIIDDGQNFTFQYSKFLYQF
jgi:hypothetical protein